MIGFKALRRHFTLKKEQGKAATSFEYILNVGNRRAAYKDELMVETREKFGRLEGMITGRDQAELLKFMVGLMGAKRGIEVGTFTGYSALCFAEALPEDGKLVCLDVSKEFTDLAVKYWKKAGVDHKIELQLGPATEYLEKLISEGGEGTFDFGFIDADKENYQRYYEYVLKLLRKGGFVAIDNVLWSGKVVGEDESAMDEETLALKRIGEYV